MSDDLKKIQMRIGGKIRFFRKKHDLSQLDLARIANLPSASRVSEYERGTYSIGLETLLKISKALNVEVADLLDNQDLRFLESELEQLNTHLLSLINHATQIKKQIDQLNLSIKQPRT